MLCYINIHLYFSLHIDKAAFDEYYFVCVVFLIMCHESLRLTKKPTEALNNTVKSLLEVSLNEFSWCQ